MSSIHSGSHTPSFAPSSGESNKAAEEGSKTLTAKTAPAAKTFDSLSEPISTSHTKASPTPSAPRPTAPPRIRPGTKGSDVAMLRSASARDAVTSSAPSGDAVRSIASEPVSAVARKASPRTEYQEHFYELGSLIVDPKHGEDAQKLARVIDRREGLKIYLYEPQPGKLYAISHAASEATSNDDKSTQHKELQRALLMYGVARSSGRFATEDKEQMRTNKQLALKALTSDSGTNHGGLRLQKHNDEYVLDVSLAFSFHGASDTSMEQIARFYATVLRYTDDPPQKVSVIPSEASCNKKYLLEALPHLQDLARRIELHLED